MMLFCKIAPRGNNNKEGNTWGSTPYPTRVAGAYRPLRGVGVSLLLASVMHDCLAQTIQPPDLEELRRRDASVQTPASEEQRRRSQSELLIISFLDVAVLIAVLIHKSY
jgi:hypothetical protein